MNFYFKNTKKDIIMTQKDKEIFEIISICRFCEKENTDNKVRDHCHLTGNYRGPARNTCNTNVKRKIVILLVLFYITSVFMIVIFFSNS